MTTATTASKKTATVITAPKLATAWANVCSTSGKAENEIIKSVENLSAVMVLESGLSVRDIKKFIKDTGKVSAFVSVSHVEALPTWSKLRALHADFQALPLARQLSTASASYSLLGAGNGEKYKSLDALTKEIATVRKSKNTKSADPKPSKEKATKNPLAEMLAYFTALNTDALDDSQKDILAEIQFVIEGKMANA